MKRTTCQRISKFISSESVGGMKDKQLNIMQRNSDFEDEDQSKFIMDNEEEEEVFAVEDDKMPNESEICPKLLIKDKCCDRGCKYSHNMRMRTLEEERRKLAKTMPLKQMKQRRKWNRRMSLCRTVWWSRPSCKQGIRIFIGRPHTKRQWQSFQLRGANLNWCSII